MKDTEPAVPNDCAGALVCATFSPEQAATGAKALFQTLQKPPAAPFFQVRAAILDEAEKRDESDALWRLHTTAEAALTPSPYLGKMLSVDPPPPGIDVE
jgi:hypothetical protein